MSIVGTAEARKVVISRKGMPGPLSMSGKMPPMAHKPPPTALVVSGTP